MLFQIKTIPEDFKVQELLFQNPEGEGDVFYVQFEKRLQTTMEIVEHLGRICGFSREEIGIAGLKDKDGVTTQWLTLYRHTLEETGGESKLLEALSQKVTILQTSWGKTFLKVGMNKGNHFDLVVRLKTPFTDQQKLLFETNCAHIQKNGYPNCFGSQRFGKRNKNFYEAQKILNGEIQEMGYHLRFMLQSFASMRFNEYVMTRRKKGQYLLDGDLVVDQYSPVNAHIGVYHHQVIHPFDYFFLKNEKSDTPFFEADYFQGSLPFMRKIRIPTGPMLGRNLLLASQGSKARVHEDLLLQQAEFSHSQQMICKTYQLRGIRRPLRNTLSDFQYHFNDTMIQLSFSLPTGSYATTLLSFLFEGIDPLSLKENRLEIPLLTR